ncbi:MAG: CTP synthase [Firmicutes bacterium]|nr:CTP synthase [Bacillota bacterium]
METKYIFISGGVVSGLGKGITAASLGRLLKARGYKIAMQKFDPYINVDPGTMSPYQHGEVFVTDDGTETDLDMGHYERFTDESMSHLSNITTGKVYWNVIQKERRGEYLGGTVQIIPHITNEIKSKVYQLGTENDCDFVITEIGGTVGDIESQPFLESMRQVQVEVGRQNCLFIHLTLVPYISGSNELKSKPTQHSVKELLSLGIQPDILVCRADAPIPDDMKRKIALFCNVSPDNVIENLTASSIYEVPVLLENEGLAACVLNHFGLVYKAPDLSEWNKMLDKERNPVSECKVALVGKYVELHDAYLSVAESLHHAGIENMAKVNISWIQSENIDESNYQETLKGFDAILVPGGFGDRGIEGKILAIKYARENNIPFLGICLGMQMAVVEFARNAAGMTDANSSEINPSTTHPVIDLMNDQKDVTDKGGTMRLGAYPCRIEEKSNAFDAYGTTDISERHRHRYEVNNSFKAELEEKGLKFTGMSPDGVLCEIVEIPEHKWFVGVQFHPEFKSRPNKAHPLFREFIKHAIDK